MNYRHAFHAGNFADLAKHAILTDLLAAAGSARGPLTVIDTHAGAGLYDLEGADAKRTGEAAAGVVRLMAAPEAPGAFDALRAAVRAANPRGGLRYYPGSPVLIAAALRPKDAYLACELRPDDSAALRRSLGSGSAAEVVTGDGWVLAARRAPAAPAGLLVLIDPPFERGDDYARTVELVGALHRVNPRAVIAIWVPIKDLATWDGFLCEVEDAAGSAPVLAAELRLRPLSDPMRLNGCAMVVINPTDGLEGRARAALDWLAGNLGEAGALAKVSVTGAAA